MDYENEFQPDVQQLLPFDPIVLVQDVLRRWYLILIITLLCGVASYIYNDATYEPVYQSSATLVITSHGGTTTVYSNLDSAKKTADVFSQVLNSSLMRKTILEELGVDSFQGSISANVIESTNLMTLRVTANDPRTAFLVIRALLEHHEVVTYEVIGDVSVEVLQPPTVPTGPINYSGAQSAMKRAMIMALAASVLLFAFLSYIRDAVRSLNEAERKLDCWCLGEIHHEIKLKSIRDWFSRKKRSILITNPDTGFRYVTTITKLRRRVEQHMHHKKVLMVTSVVENEGKSTVAVNLALSMVKKRRKVLLIDCDLHKPACRKILEQPVPEYFIQDVIRGTVPLNQAVLTDRRSGLDLLCAKKVSNQVAGDLLASGGLAAMLEQAREAYDFVVIDLPPMSVATDPEYLMEYVDASLLVARQNAVTAPVLNKAIGVLQRGNAKLLGCVLNNVYASRLSSGEDYGNGYRWYGGYGKYGNHGRYGKYGRYGAYAGSEKD